MTQSSFSVHSELKRKKGNMRVENGMAMQSTGQKPVCGCPCGYGALNFNAHMGQEMTA